MAWKNTGTHICLTNIVEKHTQNQPNDGYQLPHTRTATISYFRMEHHRLKKYTVDFIARFTTMHVYAINNVEEAHTLE